MVLKNIWLHYWGVFAHKLWVAAFLLKICGRLLLRALLHDCSKCSPSEARGFISVIHKLKHSTYGTEEYRELLRSIKPSIELHYQRNRHHPEHFPRGVKDMDLVDVTEMWCDWRAAVKRHADGDVNKSIAHNTERFQLGDVLPEIFRNEVKKGIFRGPNSL